MSKQVGVPESLDEIAGCVGCGSPSGVLRVDFHSRGIISVCDDCCDRRATACPFCDNPFGREVKRASKCKKCGETVARSSDSVVLATRLATPAICDALSELQLANCSAVEETWLRTVLLECLLAATRAGRQARAIDDALAAALRDSFERGLTRERLSKFGAVFARAIWLCGGNPRAIQRTLHRSYLGSLRESGSSASIEIFTEGDSCDKCRALRGKVWTIAEALAENPLPCRDCANTNENGFGWCRCQYEQRFDEELEAILAEGEAEGEVRAQAESRRIMSDWEKGGSRGMVPTSHGGAVSVEEAAKIATNGWHYVRNRGKRGLNDGCNGALEALREAGIAASTTPNRERPVFNDIVLTASGGRSIVLKFCTATWEFIERRD